MFRSWNASPTALPRKPRAVSAARPTKRSPPARSAFHSTASDATFPARSSDADHLAAKRQDRRSVDVAGAPDADPWDMAESDHLHGYQVVRYAKLDPTGWSPQVSRRRLRSLYAHHRSASSSSCRWPVAAGIANLRERGFGEDNYRELPAIDSAPMKWIPVSTHGV